MYGELHVCRNKGLQNSWGTFANDSLSLLMRDTQNIFSFFGGTGACLQNRELI